MSRKSFLTDDLAVAAGFSPGMSSLAAVAQAQSMPKDSAVDIWSGMTTVPELSNFTSAELLSFVSTSSNDAAPSGTGARSLLITGLDENWDETSEIVALTGMTPVLSVGLFIRVHEVIVLQAGNPTTRNIGTINCTGATSAKLQARVRPNIGRSSKSHRTIPAQKRGAIRFLGAFLRGQGSTAINLDLTIQIRFNTDLPGFDDLAWISLGQAHMTTAATSIVLTPNILPTQLQPKTDIRVRGIADSNGTQVSLLYKIWLYDDDGELPNVIPSA